MRRFTLAAGLLTLGLSLGAIPASAQGFVGGGLSMPSGDYGDYAKSGWIVNAGFRPWQSVDKRASIWAEGLYGSNKHEGSVGDGTNLYGGFGSVTYNVTAEASAVPYVIGSVGYLVHHYSPGTSGFDSDSQGALSFGGGAGVGVKKFYLEARYLTAKIDGSTTAFIMFTAGYTF